MKCKRCGKSYLNLHLCFCKSEINRGLIVEIEAKLFGAEVEEWFSYLPVEQDFKALVKNLSSYTEERYGGRVFPEYFTDGIVEIWFTKLNFRYLLKEGSIKECSSFLRTVLSTIGTENDLTRYLIPK